MFFESKFKTEDLKKLCLQICKSKIQKNKLEVIGAVMKAMGGQVDAARVRELILERAGS